MTASFTISQMAASSQFLKPSATMYVIGNIKEGHLPNAKAAFCKWEVIYNEKNWILEKGEQCGQTWIAETDQSTESRCLWSHPLDLEFRCKAVSGAPKLYLEIYSSEKAIDFYGYGLIHLPIHYGKHTLSIPLSRPSASTGDWISSLFWGGNIRYKNPKDMLLKTDDKFPHRTESCGNVTVEINILKTGFPNYVNFNSPTK